MKAKTLHLNLHKKWFDMILSGEKKEEYRDFSSYWEKRLSSNDYDTITFSNGMKPLSQLRRFTCKYVKIELGFHGKKEWGASNARLKYVIHVGEIIERHNC